MVRVTSVYWSEGYFSAYPKSQSECDGVTMPGLGVVGIVGCDCHNNYAHEVWKHDDAQDRALAGEEVVDIEN